MVDILAKQRPHTQTELDSKLTPIGQKLRESSLISKPGIVKDYMLTELPLIQDERIAVKTKAQSQTQASAKEGLVERPESNDVAEIENVSTVQEGEVKPSLVDRPVMYAAEGLNDVEVDRPIVVGEKEREVIFPSKNGISIVPVSSLVKNPNERSEYTGPFPQKKPEPTLEKNDRGFNIYSDNPFIQRIIEVESSANPNAINEESGAVGLMQILPSTAKQPGFKTKAIDPDDLTNPNINIEFGTQYINGLTDYYNGNQRHALAAYNYGAGNINKWLEETGGDESKLPKETRDYLNNIMGTRKSFGLPPEQKSAIEIEPASVQQAGFLFRNRMTPDKPSGAEQLLDYFFPKKEKAKEKGRPKEKNKEEVKEEVKDAAVKEDKEPFDPNKLVDPDSYSGISIDYFYDNLDEMVDYSIELKKGEDYVPTYEEKQAERQELQDRFNAFFDMQMQDTNEQIEERNFNELRESDPDFLTEA